MAGATRTVPVVISTGSEQGIYFQAGKEIGDSYMNRHQTVRDEMIPSEESHLNVARLQYEMVDIAIAQNDAVADERVRSLAIFYREVLHLVCRKDAGVNRPNNLKGHSTSLGTLPGKT